MENTQVKQQHTALQVCIESKADLYAAYMPFISHGGLFIHSKKSFQFGDDVFLLLKLFDDLEKYPINGTVVWMTPLGAQMGMPAGIGVQFSEDDASVCKRIENLLAGMNHLDRHTDTM